MADEDIPTELPAFLRKHRIVQSDFAASGIKWDELRAIGLDHASRREDLESVAESIVGKLSRVTKVHSVRWRVKDTEHLMEKVIRKSIERQKRAVPGQTTPAISRENYTQELTDLIGVRVLHLYKSDWVAIHDEITSKWQLNEPPVVHHRGGDSRVHLLEYQSRAVKLKEHDFGYRSIHYLIKPTDIFGNTLIAEVQVRTLVEEAWSEIDHEVRYPNLTGNDVVNAYLSMFSSIAGSLDEMATVLKQIIATGTPPPPLEPAPTPAAPRTAVEAMMALTTSLSGATVPRSPSAEGLTEFDPRFSITMGPRHFSAMASPDQIYRSPLRVNSDGSFSVFARPVVASGGAPITSVQPPIKEEHSVNTPVEKEKK